MAHPNREELAGRLEDGARAIEIDGTPSQIGPTPADLREAAAALRQSPSVEDLARLVLEAVFEGFEHGQCEKEWEPDYGKQIAESTAQAIAELYRRGE